MLSLPCCSATPDRSTREKGKMGKIYDVSSVLFNITKDGSSSLTAP